MTQSLRARAARSIHVRCAGSVAVRVASADGLDDQYAACRPGRFGAAAQDRVGVVVVPEVQQVDQNVVGPVDDTGAEVRAALGRRALLARAAIKRSGRLAVAAPPRNPT